jgi:hypothetical protein
MSDDAVNTDSLDDLCKDCGPTFTAFLEQMAAHNKEQKEQMEELQPKVVCPTCGKVHAYSLPRGTKAIESPAS